MRSRLRRPVRFYIGYRAREVGGRRAVVSRIVKHSRVRNIGFVFVGKRVLKCQAGVMKLVFVYSAAFLVNIVNRAVERMRRREYFFV